MDISLIVIIAIVAILGIYLWSTYNGLVTLNVRVDEAWSDITVQLKRRADLIPNLIETVKGYASHERGVFEDVTKARAETLSASTPAEAAKAEGQLTTIALDAPLDAAQADFGRPHPPVAPKIAAPVREHGGGDDA